MSRFAAQPALLLLAASTALAQPSFQNGDVFAGGGDGKIRRYDPRGNLIQVIDDGLSGPKTGMCFDAQGNLYATSFSARSMSKFDRRGKLLQRSWGGPFNHPESCLIDSQGSLYSGEVLGSRNLIRKFDLQGNLLAQFSPAIEAKGIDWIDLAADQCTIFYTSEGSTVKRFDVCQNRQLPDFAGGLRAPCFALRIRYNGELMVACQDQAYRLSPSGDILGSYPLSGQIQFAMNLDPDGASFWTGGLNTGEVYRINIETGAGATSPVLRAQTRKGFLEDLLSANRDLQRLLGGRAGGEQLFGLAVFGEPTAAVAAPPPEPPSRTLPPVTLQARVPPDAGLSALNPAIPPSLLAAAPGAAPEPPPAAAVTAPPVDDVPSQPAPQPETPRSSIDFGNPSQVSFGELGSQQEAAARLDLSSSQVEGSPLILVSTNLDLRGVSLQIETANGWVGLSRQPAALTLSSGSALHWPVRAKTGDCPAALGSQQPLILVESTGRDGSPARLQIPLSLRILPDSWLHCWWPLLAAALGCLLTGVIAYGFISPSRFGPRIGVVLSQEEDMSEGFFHPIRGQRGSRSGFYRDARIYIHSSFKLSRKSAGALARLRANDAQVRIQPWSGSSIQRRTLDDQWEALPPGESHARPGTVFRDELGTIFFELRTG